MSIFCNNNHKREKNRTVKECSIAFKNNFEFPPKLSSTTCVFALQSELICIKETIHCNTFTFNIIGFFLRCFFGVLGRYIFCVLKFCRKNCKILIYGTVIRRIFLNYLLRTIVRTLLKWTHYAAIM